jgi:carboxyl-terminal processing protease
MMYCAYKLDRIQKESIMDRLNTTSRQGQQEYPDRHMPHRTYRGVHPLTTVVLILVFMAMGFLGGATTVWVYRPSLRQVVAARAPFLFGNTDVEQLAELPIEEYREQRAQLLWNIWDILEREYIDPEAIDREKMIYGAASGMVQSLGDPHTSFVEPLPARIMREDLQGTFEGIGATVNMIEGELTIVRPLPNSPALEAGLREGDVVLKVDDKSIEGLSLLEAVSLIRGPEGTVVRLLVRREGVEEPFIVPVTRSKIETPIVESRMLEGDVAYLKLTEFNALSDRKVNAALAELLAEEPVGLILDLRDNPGGYLQKAIDIASEFLPRGSLVLVEQERSGPGQDVERTEYRATGPSPSTRGGATPRAAKIPMVVLVNGGSASASEIVAGAIRDNDRGILIGQRTYGKGSVQNTHRLEDESSLRVTIARWYRPNGEPLDGSDGQEAGIEPDIVVEITAEDREADRDPQLQQAIEVLTNGV